MTADPEQEPPVYKLKYAILRLQERVIQVSAQLDQTKLENERLKTAIRALLDQQRDVSPCEIAEANERLQAQLSAGEEQGRAWAEEKAQHEEKIRTLALPNMPAPEPKKPHTPQIVDWRTWSGFRADMLGRYEAKRQEYKELGISAPIKIETIAGHKGHGDSAATIEYTMRDPYELDPKVDWPPPKWPKEDPRLRRRDEHNGHAIAAVLAFAPVAWMLDAVLGGRFDGIPHLSKLVGCLFGVEI